MLILTTAINFRHHQVSQEILESKAHGGSPCTDTGSTELQLPSPERSHLHETPKGLEVLQVILCEHTASPPAQTSSERRRNKPLETLNSCTPTMPHPRPTSASPSVLLAALTSASHSGQNLFSPVKHGCVWCPSALAANQSHAPMS